MGGPFEVRQENRPLNVYVFPEIGVRGGAAVPPTDSSRFSNNLVAFEDPSDKVTHQRVWPAASTTMEPADAPYGGGIPTCFDDVGSSYQRQAKWFEHLQATPRMPANYVTLFEIGARRFKIAGSFTPSRMVWLNDEWADIIINQGSASARVKNGYDDVNKAVMGFMDAHGAYLNVLPDGGTPPSPDEWDRIPAFNNEKYTVIFPFVR